MKTDEDTLLRRPDARHNRASCDHREGPTLVAGLDRSEPLQSRCRSGFTLIELFICIVVIIVVVALIISLIWNVIASFDTGETIGQTAPYLELENKTSPTNNPHLDHESSSHVLTLKAGDNVIINVENDAYVLGVTEKGVPYVQKVEPE